MMKIKSKLRPKKRKGRDGFTLFTVLIGIFLITALFTLVSQRFHNSQTILKALNKNSLDAQYKMAAQARASLELANYSYTSENSAFIKRLQDGDTTLSYSIEGETVEINFIERASEVNLKYATLKLLELEFRSLGLNANLAKEFVILREENFDEALVELFRNLSQSKSNALMVQKAARANFGAQKYGYETLQTSKLKLLARDQSNDRDAMIAKLGRQFFYNSDIREFWLSVE